MDPTGTGPQIVCTTVPAQQPQYGIQTLEQQPQYPTQGMQQQPQYGVQGMMQQQQPQYNIQQQPQYPIQSLQMPQQPQYGLQTPQQPQYNVGTGGVQWSLEPYFTADGVSRSKVLRSIPGDYFKKYSGNLTQISGKFNPQLKHPNDPNARLPGWIFSNKTEQQVRQLVTAIVAGQVQPIATQAQTYQAPSMLQSGVPGQFTMQAPGFPAQQPSSFQSAIPGPSTLVPITTQGGQVNPRMQAVSVLKPVVGETLYIIVSGQRYPAVVQSITEEDGFTTKAITKVGEQLSEIELVSSTPFPKMKWVVAGYTTPHSVDL